jgi:hypothetical protein
MLLRHCSFSPPLFRFFYGYIAELPEVYDSKRTQTIEQYVKNPHIYDELIEEEYTKFVADLDLDFDIEKFRRELMMGSQER